MSKVLLVGRELLPCPFCGQQEAFVEQLDSDASVVICQGMVDEHSACLARGPVGVQQSDMEDQPGKDAAIVEWNRRAQPAEADGPSFAEVLEQASVIQQLGAKNKRIDELIAALSAVTAERDRLRDQVKALQSDANSWQSGYDKGRHDGTKHRHSEVAQLRAEVEALQSRERYREQDLAVVIEQRDHYANRVLHLETSALRIAGDYQPSSDAESALALDEMRAALVGLVGAAMSAKEA